MSINFLIIQDNIAHLYTEITLTVAEHTKLANIALNS